MSLLVYITFMSDRFLYIADICCRFFCGIFCDIIVQEYWVPLIRLLLIKGSQSVMFFWMVNGCDKKYRCRLSKPGVSWFLGAVKASEYFYIADNRECLVLSLWLEVVKSNVSWLGFLVNTYVFRTFLLSWKEHHNTGIRCNPFSGKLTHSTRQMREHKAVSSNYRHLSTSTIVFVEEGSVRKGVRMFQIFVLCFLEEGRKWLLDRRLDGVKIKTGHFI